MKLKKFRASEWGEKEFKFQTSSKLILSFPLGGQANNKL